MHSADNYPSNYLYSKDHEWLEEKGQIVRLGITDFAQSELGELVFVDLPAVGTEFNAGDSVCVVESTKAASDVYTPVSGKIVAVNENLEAEPALINQEPHTNGWLVELELKGELADLMQQEQYLEFLNNE